MRILRGNMVNFMVPYRASSWYIQEKKDAEALAVKLGYNKVSQEKLDVALKIRDYVIGGGFMFCHV